jgi:uncharacterized protein
MYTPRKALRLNVGFIVHQEIGFEHDFPLAFEEIQVADDLILYRLAGHALVRRTPQGLLTQGDFEAEIITECVRCLKPFLYHAHWQFTELYAFSRKSLTESGLLLPEDHHIDLAPLTRDYALLEIPINPICSPECKGLCPVCGEDLNLRDCGHRPYSLESPFAVLRSLLSEDDESL